MTKEKNQPLEEEVLKNEETTEETVQTEENQAEDTVQEEAPAAELTVEEQLANMFNFKNNTSLYRNLGIDISIFRICFQHIGR